MFQYDEFVELTGVSHQEQVNLMLNLLVESLKEGLLELNNLEEFDLASQEVKDLLHRIKGIAAQSGLEELVTLCINVPTLISIQHIHRYINQVESDIQQYLLR